jgi:hypothetical protein
VFDTFGDLVGIKPDAPENAKKAYKEFRKVMDKAERKGIRL